MIVVADTSPLNYLLLIDEIEILPDVFGNVLFPRAVAQELQHPKSSPKVRDWVSHLPGWAEMRNVAAVVNPTLISLDLGEREAIQLALELGIGTVLIDEAEGRRQAEKMHLEVRGTLGVLEQGQRLGKLDLRQALSKLQRTNFRLSPAVRAALLERNP